MKAEAKYANIAHLIGCYSLYIQYIYIEHDYLLFTSGLLLDLMNLNDVSIFHKMYSISAIQSSLIYIPVVALNSWIPSVSCSYLVFPEVNV